MTHTHTHTHTHTDNFRASVLSDPRLESFDAVVCFSPLRWAFVFHRPRHLMTRFSKAIPVYFFAEPIVFADSRVLRPELPVALHRLATARAPGPRKLVNTDYREVVKSLRRDRLIHTGPIDEFFTTDSGQTRH